MTMLTTSILALFSMPLDVPTKAISLLWVLPVGLAISLVYKSVKLEDVNIGVFVREVILLFLTGIGMLVFSSLVLLAVTWIVQLWGTY